MRNFIRVKGLLHELFLAGMSPLAYSLSLYLKFLHHLPPQLDKEPLPKPPRSDKLSQVKISSYGDVAPHFAETIRHAFQKVAVFHPVEVPVEVFVFPKDCLDMDPIAEDICAALDVPPTSRRGREAAAWVHTTAQKGQAAQLRFEDKAGLVIFPIHESSDSQNKLIAMHEYFHIVQQDRCRNPHKHNLFYWYSEGTAEYIGHFYMQQFGWGTLEEAKRFYMQEIWRDGPERNLAEFERHNIGPVYALGFWAVHFLLHEKKIPYTTLFETLLSDIATLGFQGAFEQSTKLTLPTFYREFEIYKRIHLFKYLL